MPAIVCTTCGKKFQAPNEGMACCPRCSTPAGLPVETAPEPSGEEWFYQVMGEAIGPVPFATLQQLARDGKISAETQVRRAAGSRWLLAERVSGLFDAPEEQEQWFFTLEGKKLGPVAYAMLRKLIVAGQLSSEDLLWQRYWPNAITMGKCIADNLLMLSPEEIAFLQTPREIPFTCPACGDSYTVDRSLSGKKLLCRSCNCSSPVH